MIKIVNLIYVSTENKTPSDKFTKTMQINTMTHSNYMKTLVQTVNSQQNWYINLLQSMTRPGSVFQIDFLTNKEVTTNNMHTYTTIM